MAIQVNLIKNPGFVHNALVAQAASTTSQNQDFKNFEIQNGYGTATSVSISPGFGATVKASVDIKVWTVSEQTFHQIINEVKQSQEYASNSAFKQMVDSASYEEAGSASSGIFGWLVGRHGGSYSNKTSNLTNQINKYDSGNASNDLTVANTVANIMVKNRSEVHVTATISVTGQLLTPSPTVLAIELTTFSYTDSTGNTSSVAMINQTPVVPVDASNGTVSNNTLAPGSKLTFTPIGN